MSSQIGLRSSVVPRLLKILILPALFGVVFLSGEFTEFMDVPGLVFVLLGLAAMTLMSFSGSEIIEAIKNAWGGWDSNSNLNRAIYFWESAARNVFMMGVLGTIVGFMVMLSNLEEGIKYFFSEVGVRFLSTIYGLILAAIFAVPALVFSGIVGGIGVRGLWDEIENGEIEAPRLRTVECFIGYVAFLSLLLWVMLTPWSSDTFAPLQLFIHWPSLLVVVGGALAISLLIGNHREGETVTLSFAFTGLIGSLVGVVKVLHGLSEGSIADIAAAVTFIISSCFVALLGMMAIGIPLKDRMAKKGLNQNLSLSRIAWFGFPLLTLIYLSFVVALIVTPMHKTL
jgi:flagellar motor component MotA